MLGVEIPDPFFYGALLILIPYLITASVAAVRTLTDHEARIKRLEKD